jgi:hypothetical protein
MRLFEQCCFVCLSAALVREALTVPDAVDVDCPGCGAFIADVTFWRAAKALRAREPSRFERLSHWLRVHSQQGRRLVLRPDTWERFTEPPPDSK